jgi:hypothetical protein
MLMKKQLFAAAAALALTGLTGVSGAVAATSTQVITETEIARQPENTTPTKNWVLYNRNAGAGAFRTGPAGTSQGTGSIQLTTPSGADKVFLFNFDHEGTALSDVDALSYATYRSAGSAQQVTALNIVADFNGAADGGFTTLVFEPVYNTGQGAVVSGAWQVWDAYQGGQAIWWSSRPIPGVCAFDCFVTWDAILAANPDAVIKGGLGLNQGSGNPGLTTAVDYLTFNDTTYNFELIKDLDGDGIPDTAPPTNKDQCKKDGYKNFNNPSFKNQGDCVSYTNNGK